MVTLRAERDSVHQLGSKAERVLEALPTRYRPAHQVRRGQAVHSISARTDVARHHLVYAAVALDESQVRLPEAQWHQANGLHAGWCTGLCFCIEGAFVRPPSYGRRRKGGRRCGGGELEEEERQRQRPPLQQAHATRGSDWSSKRAGRRAWLALLLVGSSDLWRRPVSGRVGGEFSTRTLHCGSAFADPVSSSSQCTGVLPHMFSPADAALLEAFTEVVAGCLMRFRNQNILDYSIGGGGVQPGTAGTRRGNLSSSLHLSMRRDEEESPPPAPFTPVRYTSPSTARLVKQQLAATDKTWNEAVAEPHVGEFKQHRFRPFDKQRPAIPKPVGVGHTRSPYTAPPIWPYNPTERRAKNGGGAQWQRRRLRQTTIDAVSNILKLQPIFRG